MNGQEHNPAMTSNKLSLVRIQEKPQVPVCKRPDWRRPRYVGQRATMVTWQTPGVVVTSAYALWSLWCLVMGFRGVCLLPAWVVLVGHLLTCSLKLIDGFECHGRVKMPTIFVFSLLVFNFFRLFAWYFNLVSLSKKSNFPSSLYTH